MPRHSPPAAASVKRRLGAMRLYVIAILGIAATNSEAPAQGNDREHSWVLEVGPATEWPLRKERANYGGTIAAEKEVIENWLELEFGLTMLGTSGRRELSADLLFKKPFHVSPEFEFMIGAGPSLSRPLNGQEKRLSVSASFALDFMFWPGSGDMGWYFEPAFNIDPKNGQKSFGVTGGLIIGFQ
jgi:hypothetical protein